MNKTILILILIFSFTLTTVGCGDDASEESVNCETGEYKCDGSKILMCRYQNGRNFWEERTDCSQSSVSGCQCVIVQGVGSCSTTSGMDGYCGE